MFSKELFCSGRRKKTMFTCDLIKRVLSMHFVDDLGPVVQSVGSLTSSLLAKM